MTQNQHDFQKVQRHIIEPMTRIYNPPAHLRDDPKAFADALEEYGRVLSGYSADTLQKGWNEVKDGHKTWIWPHFQAIRDACERLKPSNESASPSGGSFRADLYRREETARVEARQFLAAFESSPLAIQARAEGWERPLLAYATEAAGLQALYIRNVPNPGFGSMVLIGGARPPQDELTRRCNDFVGFCRRQAQTGTIDVQPPGYLVAEWRARAASGRTGGDAA